MLLPCSIIHIPFSSVKCLDFLCNPGSHAPRHLPQRFQPVRAGSCQLLSGSLYSWNHTNKTNHASAEYKVARLYPVLSNL